jgi:hypothetical protein
MKTHDNEDIVESLTRLTNRINIHSIIKYASISLFFGAGITAMFILASKLVPIPVPFIPAIIAIIGLSLIIGIIIGVMKRISLIDSARVADNKLNLKDRLASAVEIINNNNIKLSAMAELQLEDASNYARKLDPKVAYPHIVPLNAKLLPIAIIALSLLTFIPARYGEPSEIRQAIQQVGTKMETLTKEIDKSELSDEVSKLVSKAEDTGQNLQSKNVTKKEALEKISDLNRRVEAIKAINELSKNLKGEITPEKKLLLNELLEKLADNLKDFPDMTGLAQKISNTQQANLSNEAIKELIRALDEKRLASTDMRILQQLSLQLASGKQEITQKITTAFRTRSASGNSENIDQKAITSSGEGAPGNESIKASDTEPSRRLNLKGIYNAELEGKVSAKGSVVKTESVKTPEKGTSVVPYEKLYFEYRDSADNAVARSAIPRVYKEQVKRYFDAIKPQGK